MSKRVALKKQEREAIIARDECECVKCSLPHSLHVHHIVPVLDGGSNDPENLITLCSRCHDEWRAIEPYCTLEFGDWLATPPYAVLVSIVSRMRKGQISIADIYAYLTDWREMYKQSLVSHPRLIPE